ncbi:restriction endonuclease subunit S [uncultured Selenomonas sp.]|uniref:restriction endonuclease subunit S n=1 Tax=uncultured Selenomonas sp. TaxID=159275 RepID=UPI0025F83427|nr:restriction endonuclease subunit S [uncultured Selenomonas sp.]
MKRVKLSDAFDLQMGKTPSRKHLAYWRGGTEPWISIADLSNCGKYIEQTKENITSDAVQESNIKIVPKNTVVMSFKLSIGKVAITKRDMYTNEAIMAFHDRGRYEILTDYLYYFCKGNNWTSGTNKAVMGLTLNKKTLSEQTMLLPDMPEQEKIVKKLDALQESISNRQHVLMLLDELVRSRFVEMFGDPVTNPFGFQKMLLKDVAEIKIGPFGSLLHQDDYVEGQHALVNPSHIRDDTIVPDNKLTVSEERYRELEAYHLRKYDIVLGRRGEMGRAAVVEENGLLCGTGSLFIRVKRKVNPYFLQKIITYPTFKKYIESKSIGTTMQNLNAKMVSNFEIPIYPLPLQTQFSTFVHQVDATKSSVQSQLDSLTTLRAKLMQDFFG